MCGEMGFFRSLSVMGCALPHYADRLSGGSPKESDLDDRL